MEQEIFKGVSNRKLYYLSNNTDKSYKRIVIKKKNGGKRVLHVPNKDLKWCQHCIVEDYLNIYCESRYATAYHKGATILSNATPHIGKKYILKLDIEDFFGSITFASVYKIFKKQYPLNYSKLLAELCCFQDSLVQGSPASPKLSNLVLYDFDEALGKWCEDRGIAYTRYCDDLTFSSNEKLNCAYYKAKRMLASLGFTLNNEKTHFVKSTHQQNVTGVVVNEKAQVSSEYRRAIRQELYYCKKFGVENHLKHKKLELNANEYLQSLGGRINYVLSINPNDSEFKAYKNDLRELKLKSN